jgi:hypothetical protein
VALRLTLRCRQRMARTNIYMSAPAEVASRVTRTGASMRLTAGQETNMPAGGSQRRRKEDSRPLLATAIDARQGAWAAQLPKDSGDLCLRPRRVRA